MMLSPAAGPLCTAGAILAMYGSAIAQAQVAHILDGRWLDGRWLDGRWTGTASGKATGEATQCWPMRFDFVIRGAAVTGTAAIRMKGAEARWRINGTAKADGTLTLVAESAGKRLETREMKWLGRLAADDLHLGQPSGRACNPGSSGILSKS